MIPRHAIIKLKGCVLLFPQLENSKPKSADQELFHLNFA